MRVLVTLPWGERLGGAEAMMQAVLDGSRELGHELDLVFLAPGPWPLELQRAGFRVEVLDAGQLRRPDRFVVTVLRLARLLRRHRPQLVLNWAAKTQLYGAPAALIAGLGGRVVWWQQNIPDGNWIDRAATLLPARAVGCYSQAAADAQRRLWPSRRTLVVAAGVRPVDLTVGARPADLTVGTRPAGLATGATGHGAHALNGAAAQSDRRPPFALPADRPIVGIVGRLQPWKGQQRLLEAHALLKARGRRLHTLVVGGDAYGLSPRYAASLPRLVERLGLGAEVTMTGQVPDAGPYIELMDVLVNASDPEPFGIVLLEAMARGVAVVAVDSGGPAEFVEHGRSGMLASGGDPVALAAAIEPLLDSAEQRARVGAAGRERFLGEFTDSALRERFFGQLERLLGDEEPRVAAPA